MNTAQYRRPRGTYTQGNVNPRIPREATVHLDDTDERRVRLGITDTYRVLCRNGSYHVTLTRNPSRVTCPACLAKINPTK